MPPVPAASCTAAATTPATSAPDSLTPGLQHRYASLLPELCIPWQPARVPQPALAVFNHALARELGWPAEAFDSPAGAELLAGNTVPPEAQPVAQGYAGHQFGGYSPQLGDGRALLLGEVRDAAGRLRDVAFKGSGRTPFSRGGDGKAALGPMLREYLVSEAMHALGVPTTRSLAVATTGERIRRDHGPQPGAVLTRVAASHIRVGTFQWVAGQDDEALLRRLADVTLARHCPDLALAPAVDSATAPGQPATPTSGATNLAMLAAVCERQARLVAQWMGLGFIHGVMNTDNMTLSGETIDYGPCAFMEAYDPATVFSSIDRGGRYAWGNQPGIAQWNLARLAEALLPLLHADTEQAVELATEVINHFPVLYQRHWLAVMRAKLGLVDATAGRAAPGSESGQGGAAGPDDAADLALIQGWLHAMQGQGVDWTLAHRHLCDVAEAVWPDADTTDAGLALSAHPASQRLRSLFADPARLDDWLPRWQARLVSGPVRPPSQGHSPGQPTSHPAERASAMRRVNPIYIPRNQRVEEALSAASDHGDMAPFHALLAVLQRPFDEAPGQDRYAQPAHPALAAGYRTFCGT